MKKLSSHVKRRALQRYGVILTKENHANLIKQIQANKGTFVGKSSLMRTHWIVQHGEKALRCVYSKKSKNIITFLPWSSR